MRLHQNSLSKGAENHTGAEHGPAHPPTTLHLRAQPNRGGEGGRGLSGLGAPTERGATSTGSERLPPPCLWQGGWAPTPAQPFPAGSWPEGRDVGGGDLSLPSRMWGEKGA